MIGIGVSTKERRSKTRSLIHTRKLCIARGVREVREVFVHSLILGEGTSTVSRRRKGDGKED